MKDWLNDIQKKVWGYEIKPSEDLIRKMEAKGILIPERRSKYHVLPVWARYAVPCATAAALAFFLLINKNGGIRAIDNTSLSSIEMVPLSSKPELLADTSLPKPEPLFLKERVIARTDDMINPSSSTDDNQVCDTTIADDPAVQSPKVTDKTVEKDPDISYVDPFVFPEEEQKPGRKSAVSLVLLGAIGTQSTYSPQAADMQAQYASKAGADWGGSQVMAMMLCSASIEEEHTIEEAYSHHIPLKFGVSVEYTMNDQWSMTSGLNYSFLESDVYDSNGNADKLGVQKLSYLGVPVNVKFNAFRAGMFNAYLTAGGIAEYCIAGRRENFCNVSGMETNTVEKYSEHPFQFSMNASAGAEYSFLSYMSLFAEVGASYYFNDGSPVQTVYKEKPLYFNTNIGIRFKFGR